MYVVADGNASGLLDKDFNEIVVLAYSSFCPLQNVLRVSKRENAHSSDDVKYGLMNYQGEIILPLAYSFIESAAPGLVWIYKNGQELVGLSTLEGNVLIEPKYGKVEPFSNNLAKVNCGRWYDDNENHIYSRSRKYSEGLWGIINIEGIEVVLPLYDRIDVDTEQGFFMVTKSIVSVERGWSSITTKSGRLNQEGRLIIKNPEGKDVLASDRFDWQEDFQGSDSTVYYHGKKGIVNTEQQLLVSIIENGKEERIVLPSEYDWGYDSMYSYILVEKDSKKGVINKEGIMIVDCIYDKIEIVSEENEIIFLCALNKTEEHQRYQPLYEWFVFSKSGKKLWPSYFEEVKVLGNALIALKNDEGKFIVSNFRGQLTSEELFDDVKEFGYTSNNRPIRYGWNQTEEEEKEEVNLRYAIVEVDGRFGVINKEGRLSIQPKYHSLSIQKDNNFIADGDLINVHEQRIAIKDGLTVFLPEGYKDEEVLQNGLILVRKGGLYGCVNRIGTIVIPIEYKSLECFGNLFSALLYDDVNKAKKWGVINIMNERIVPFSEKYIKIEIDNNIIKFMQDYCWGAFNLQGEIICEPIFDSIISVTDNLMKVGISRYNENAWKIYERYGIENCYSESLITWGLFDIKGNMILSPEYSEIADKVINELIEIKKDEKIGYADITGRIILEPTYKSIGNFIDGYAVVTKKWYDSYGVINSLFKEIIPCVFSNIKYERETGLFKTDVGYKTADGKYIAEVNGKVLYVNNKYKYCKDFHNDCAIAVQAKNNRIFYALINSKSEDVLPPIFNVLELLDNGLYKFKLNYKYGLADSKGNIILPNIYDGIEEFEDNLARVWIKEPTDNTDSYKRYGFIDFAGNEILPPLYEFILNRSEKNVVIMKNNIWGLYNIETNVITEVAEAAYLGPCRDGLCSINIGGFFDKKDRKVKDGLWGYINTDGQVAIKPLYERAQSFFEGFAAVKHDGKWGFIDKNGLSIIPCEYDEVEQRFMNGKAELIKDGYVYVFDKDGNQIDSYRPEREDDYGDDSSGYTYEELKRLEWEAMTDGQYGDYPGGDIDYDTLGFGI